MIGIFVAMLLAALAVPAYGADFKSVAENGVVMYDAPSLKARKIFVVSRDYPVEAIVNVDNWVKVRDPSGDMFWVERKSLSDRRTVVVTAAVADIRKAADARAPLVFRAQQGVVLDLFEVGSDGWARVRHRDGQSGFLRIKDVWGL